MKYDYELKLKICKEMEKTGIGSRAISHKYPLSRQDISHIFKLYKKYGPYILKHNYTNWTKQQKEEAIKRVLSGESIHNVSIDIGLSSFSTLSLWIKEYKKNGYTIVERKRGRRPMNKSSPKRKNSTQDERLKQLEKENLELRIENEYLKKLDALVQKRKAQQQRIKSK